MKRVGNLWEKLTSFENLLHAAKLAAKGKRKRTDVARFTLDLEAQLLSLRRELIGESYQPGAYRSFQINDPKPRLISAAPFRDRVVHHALTAVLEPIFERRFSKDSYACRQGFGTHRALQVAKEGVRRHRFVLKCDVRTQTSDNSSVPNLRGRRLVYPKKPSPPSPCTPKSAKTNPF